MFVVCCSLLVVSCLSFDGSCLFCVVWRFRVLVFVVFSRMFCCVLSYVVFYALVVVRCLLFSV